MEPEADQPSGLMKIKVKTLGNTVYDLEMKPEALIRDMKAKLEELSETPANLQRLVFRGHMLKDEQTLSHHNVTDGSTVHLVMRPVDTSQAPPPTSAADRAHPFGGPMGGGFPINFRGAPGGALNPNDFGQFIAGMLGSMGVQGAVQIMHTTIPMEWTPNTGGQGGQGRGRVGAQGLPGVGSTGQLAADLAQRMSDQARGAFQVNLQQQNGPGGQQSVDASQHSGHLFASIATWLNRLNDAGGSRSWPNIELPYPDYGGGAPLCSVQDFAEAARTVWEMGGWAAEEPASAFLQSSTEDVTFGRWLPGQAPEPQQAPPEMPAQEQGFDPLQVRPPNSTDSSTEQPQGHVQSGQSTEGAQPGPQQGTAQRAHAAGQPQQAEQHAAATDHPGQQRHSVSIQMSGDNPADLVAAITSALSNQERDSTDHLVSGSGSTGSMSSLVPPRTSEDTGVHAERDPRRNGMDNPYGAGYEPLHPQLALLTGYTLQRMLEETARHTQARVVPRMADICAALRRFLHDHHAEVLSGSPHATDTLQREALRAANMLHAEGVLLMEEARAAAAAILALRDNTARPLMAAGPVFLHADGSRANAGSLRAGLGSGMRPPPVVRAVRGGRGGGQPGAPAGPTPGAQAGPGPGVPLPPGMLPQPFAQFAMGGTPVRISHSNGQGGNNLTIQMGNTAAASMDMTPLVEAFESMMSSVPQLQELFQAPLAAQPGRPAQAGQQANQPQQGNASSATTAQPAGSATEPPAPAAEGAQAARSAPAQVESTQRPSALRTLALPVLQQAIPMLVSVLVSGQQARTGNPGPVLLEQQQTQEMHFPSFPGHAPPTAPPWLPHTQAANTAQGTPAAQQARPVAQAQAGAAAGGQQMRVPTFVVNAGQPNEMEVDIQAEFSEGQALPNQAAMGPLVAQIMRAVTGQAAPPARQAQQGAQGTHRSAASQPPPAQQQPQTAGATGVSRAVPGTAAGAVGTTPNSIGETSATQPEDHSDDSGWETASEESAEYNADEAAGGESASKKQKVTAGSSSEEHSKGVEGIQKQPSDSAARAGKQVQSDSQSTHSHPAPSAAAAASRNDMHTSNTSGPRSFPLTDSPESLSAPGSPQPAAPLGSYRPPQPPAPQQPQAPRGMGMALPGRPGQGGRTSTTAGRSIGRGILAQRAAAAAAASQQQPITTDAAAGGTSTVPQGLGSMGLPRPGNTAAAPTSRAVALPAVPESHIEEMQPRSGVASAQGMGGAMAGGSGLAGMMSQLMQSPAMQQTANPGGMPVQGRGGATAGGGGLAGMMSQLMQSPAMQQMAEPGAESGQDMGGPMAGGGGLAGMMSQLMQSPAMQQMADPGAVPAQGMGGATAGGSGLAGMMSQLMQSPAMQQIAGSLADRADRQGGPQQRAAPDFGSFLQDMMPVVGQMLGGLGQGGPPTGSGQRASSGGGNTMRSSAGGDELAALAELPPDQAALWRRRIMEDRVRQAGMDAPQNLSEAYLAGSSNRQDASGQGGSSDLGEGFL